jgi:AraC-like DNA-binding protein
MQTLFSTQGLHPRNRFQLWRETLLDYGVAIEWQRLNDAPFEARIEAGRIGPLQLKRIFQGGIRGEAMPGLMRRLGNDGNLSVVLKLSGTMTSLQDERCAVQGAGDILVLDHRPGILAAAQPGASLSRELPRERLERVLGPARLYTALTAGADLASSSLTMTYFRDLISVGGQLTPDAAERMSAIGVDLIVASLAERLAQEVPRSVHGTVTVQRAKAYVEAHLGDPALDPPRVAAAMGVSLRRLQELFHERDRHISDYIWHRRLEAAAARLADPGCAHLPIGLVAYGCGFLTQAHFSRRFKARFGSPPGEYRQMRLSAAR